MAGFQLGQFHTFATERLAIETAPQLVAYTKKETVFTYTFQNFFHPFVGELIARLNRESLPGMLATSSQTLSKVFFETDYQVASDKVEIVSEPRQIDISANGPYAVYNWELFFHIPLIIAVHLSKNQRFAEAQRWFHHIFDPTAPDEGDASGRPFWKFVAFRGGAQQKTIDDVVRILSQPDLQPDDMDGILQDYWAAMGKPFQPHLVARNRHIAYQYDVVMKYLDNLIAWGDLLFQQDTMETINEATQIYVLASNILGERPQRIPPLGKTKARTFAQLKQQGLGPIGDALVELEGQFPFNLATPGASDGESDPASTPLFGIGRTLYFCIPVNTKLLGYWDIVADRLFKIRHGMNLAGVVRPLALFDPPIDPGMLVKAAAAGISIAGIVNGLNQPQSPVRGAMLIQKALELCAEVRSLGNALLAALEKGEAERLALIRQQHEVELLKLVKEARFLQLKSAEAATRSLATARAATMERLRYYKRLLGLPADQNAPDTIVPASAALNEENFDEAFATLVAQYDKTPALQDYPELRLADETSASIVSGFSTSGKVYLSKNEDTELNVHLPMARTAGLAASAFNAVASGVTVVPDPKVNLHYWGIGGTVDLKVGTGLVALSKIAGDISGILAQWERDQALMTSRYASYERRADEWLLQHNLAAHELMQNGKQILSSLIAEQIAAREYANVEEQIANAGEVEDFLRTRFTNEELYLWMQGEASRLYYAFYQLAFDTASKAERTMKREVMRPELDAQDFVKFNYWDAGRKGLLAGEALYLDVKRMEMAYHDHNRRELELVRHVSLRQLDPVALLTLKATGTCQFTIPEWLFDMDCPGHYMRRIKHVALSIPAVAGPYTSVNCTVSLLRSSIRKSPTLSDGEYLRQGVSDSRFLDHAGAGQSIVTSSGQSDGGMFETNLREERFLPFEGAGAESTWKLELPKPDGFPAFDYASIPDVVLHMRYTARQGVVAAPVTAALKDLFAEADRSGLALLLGLRYDFATQWAAFGARDNAAPFEAVIGREHFPYFTRGKRIVVTGIAFHDGNDSSRHVAVGAKAEWDAASEQLNEKGSFTLSAEPNAVLAPQADVFAIVRYALE